MTLPLECLDDINCSLIWNRGSEKWLEINKKYSEIWPNINVKKDPPSDHEKYKDEQNKFEKYFKENI